MHALSTMNGKIPNLQQLLRSPIACLGVLSRRRLAGDGKLAGDGIPTGGDGDSSIVNRQSSISLVPADYVQFLCNIPADYVRFLLNIPADYV